MSIATYRGCKYNTNTPKQEYQHWYSETHAPSHPNIIRKQILKERKLQEAQYYIATLG